MRIIAYAVIVLSVLSEAGTPPLHCSKLIIIIIIELLGLAELCRKVKIKNLKIFKKVLKKLLTNALKYANIYSQVKTRAKSSERGNKYVKNEQQKSP